MSFSGPPLNPYPKDISVWSWLFQNAPDLPRDRGFCDANTGSLLSHSSLARNSILVSAALTRLYAIIPHQTVAIVARNSISYPLALFTASRLGAVVTCLPPDAQPDDLAYYFRTSSTVLVFADEHTLKSVRAAAKAITLRRDRIVLLDDVDDVNEMTLSQLLKEGHAMEVADQKVQKWKPERGNGEICAFLNFSSGTTGKPKAVRISHGNVIAQLCQMRELTRPGKPNTVLGILPFYHITGLVHLLHLPVLLQQDMIVIDKFNMKKMLDTITRYKCNELWLVPPLLIRLLNEPAVQRYDLSHVKQFDTGAAPLSEQIVAKLSQKFPDVAIRQSWGMTESTSALTTTPPGLDSWENATKVGKLVPGTEIKVVDPDTGKVLGIDEPGELWARGPQVSMGYLDNPEATASTYDAEGFLHTGDLGSIDAEGFIMIHDRLKELIKVRGNPVAPAVLEDVLHGHPSVADCAVIGAPDTYSGELPQAWVVLTPQGRERPEEWVRQELERLVESKKPRHMWLKGGVRFVDAIPKSAAGKILRRMMRESAKAKL